MPEIAGATTRLLDRIEAKGLCRRVRSQEDRRVVNIELTDAGRDIANPFSSTLHRAIENVARSHGVGVLAENTWAARQAKDALKVTWANEIGRAHV